MKTIRVTWKGETPLIMHSCKCVNPLHPLSIEMAKINAKRNKKTDEDLARLSDLEWEAGIYWDDEVGLHLPAEVIEAVVREGAKARKKGKDIVRAFSVLDMMNPVDIGRDMTYEQMKADYNCRMVNSMRVKQSRVMRTRPRFNMWSVAFTAIYDENVLDFTDIVDAIEYAGKYIGICDSRPKYGKFSAYIEEMD